MSLSIPAHILFCVLIGQAEAAPKPVPSPASGESQSKVSPGPTGEKAPKPQGQTDPGDGKAEDGGPERLSVGLTLRGAYRITNQDLGPAWGFGFGLSGEYRYGWVADALELRVGVDFAYISHQQGVNGVQPDANGVDTEFHSQRIVADNHFVALHSVALPVGNWRPWAAAGGGLAVGSLSTPEVRLASANHHPLRPVLRLAVGVEYTIKAHTFLALRFDYTVDLRKPTFTSDAGETFRIYGDVTTMAFVIGNRFK